MRLNVTKRNITVDTSGYEPLVSNNVNEYPVEFIFDNTWNNYVKTAVFERVGGITPPIKVVLDSNTKNIPWEVLTSEGYIRIGVYGDNGTKHKATVYTDQLEVLRGAKDGDIGKTPTETPYAQLLRMIGDLNDLDTEEKDNLVDAVNEVISDIPTKLSDLDADSTHRTVTDAEKATWNGKANAEDIPTKTSDLTNDGNGSSPFTTVSALTAEQTFREQADATLTSNLNTEISYRQSADTTLQTNINNEKTARENADTQIQEDLEDEITDRTNADANLQTQINNKVDKVTGKGLSTNDFTNEEKSKLDNHAENTSNPHSVTKTQVGLSNVDNTSDTDKPVSTATQTALNTKVNTNDIINNTSSTATNKPLSANMGKEIQDQINNLKARGRFLSIWHCVFGLAQSVPTVNPYTYRTGDYFIVGTVKNGGYNHSVNLSGTTITDQPFTAAFTIPAVIDESQPITTVADLTLTLRVLDIYNFPNILTATGTITIDEEVNDIIGVSIDENYQFRLIGTDNQFVGDVVVEDTPSRQFTITDTVADYTTNYKPNGATYDKDVPSTTVESENVSSGDVYYYDGTTWMLQINTQKEFAFINIAGSPFDNSALASALNNKQNNLSAIQLLAVNSGIDSTKVAQITTNATNIGNLQTTVSTKADKVTNATNGNFAGLDANGNLTDSFKKASDFSIATNLSNGLSNNSLQQTGNTAGCKGWECATATDYNRTNKTMTVSDASNLAVNDVMSAQFKNNFDLFGKITSISGNTLTFDVFPTLLQADVAVTKFYVWCPDKPNAGNYILGDNAFATGTGSKAVQIGSFAEGKNNVSAGKYSHTEGQGNTAVYSAHAENWSNKALGEASHAQGYQTTASGVHSHTEGYKTTASAHTAHAQGYQTTASGSHSFSGGVNTIAGQTAQTALGKFNNNKTDTLFEVGNGTDDNTRSNAFEVKSNGQVISGSETVANDNKALVTKKYVYDELFDEDDVPIYQPHFGTGDISKVDYPVYYSPDEGVMICDTVTFDNFIHPNWDLIATETIASGTRIDNLTANISNPQNYREFRVEFVSGTRSSAYYFTVQATDTSNVTKIYDNIPVGYDQIQSTSAMGKYYGAAVTYIKSQGDISAITVFTNTSVLATNSTLKVYGR